MRANNHNIDLQRSSLYYDDDDDAGGDDDTAGILLCKSVFMSMLRATLQPENEARARKG